MPNNMTTLENLQEVVDRLDEILSGKLLEGPISAKYVPQHMNVYMTQKQAILVRAVLENIIHNETKYKES